MNTHNIWFCGEILKIMPELLSISFSPESHLGRFLAV